MNDGEFGRISWLIYAHERLSGFKQRPVELKYATAILKGKDREEFADYYAEFAARGGLTYYKSPGAAGSSGEMRDHQPSVSDQLPTVARPCFAPRSITSRQRLAGTM